MRSAVSFAAWLIFAVTAASSWAREWTDDTGKFRVEADLVAVRNGRVILEKPDGKILTIPLERLSAADREFLKSDTMPTPAQPSTAPGTTAPTSRPSPATPVSAADAALAQQAHAVFKANCYRCHGEEGASEGGFNFALNLDKLARTLIKPRNPSGSTLWQRMSATDDSAMPPAGENPRPSAADLETVQAWIAAGAPPLASDEQRPFITNAQVVDYMLADIKQASPRSQRFLRYFTLTHLYNAGVSEDELQTYRNAFAKLINSLSWNTSLVVPQPVDPTRTVLRIDIRQLNWSSELWDEVEGANPYFLAIDSANLRACAEATQCEMPHVRVDWFVFAASKPPLYHTLLALPDTDKELEDLLRVNVAANIDQELAIRAAFNRSGVSQNNRLIEWHKSPYGSYWKSYDFGGNTGAQNLFERPLGPGAGSDSFQHDGGEIIFSLPNGLQAYLLVDAAGKRIDQGPTSIVSDPKRPDKTVTNGVSCMSCHYTGVITKTDEVGPAVRANPKAFENSADILALYREPKDLDAIFREDAGRFDAALDKLGITSQSRGGEPVSSMALRFEQELDLVMTACEFGLTPQEFEQRLSRAETTGRLFAPLRIPGGTIKRDVFATAFGQAAIEFRLSAEGAASGTFATTFTPLARLPATPGNKPGEVRRFKDLRWNVHCISFSPSGGHVAVGKTDSALLVFDAVEDRQSDGLTKLGIMGQVTACQFVPGTSRLLVGGYSGHVAIYEIDKAGKLKEAGQFAGHSKELKCFATSGDGRLAVSGGRDLRLRLWEIESGRELAAFSGGFDGIIKACYIARNGRTAMATDGATLLAVDLSKRETTATIKLTGSWAAGQAAAFSPDGSLVAAGDSYAIRLFETATGKERPVLQDNDIQWSMAFTPDGTRLLSGGNGKVNVWDVSSGRKIYSQPLDDGGYVQALAASPDNKHAAAMAARRDLMVFRLPDPER
jgi:mono/diheme cytochrome c family protein